MDSTAVQVVLLIKACFKILLSRPEKPKGGT